jgi:hypothetical protein
MRVLLAAGLALLATLAALTGAQASDGVPVRDCGSRGDPSDGRSVRFAAAKDVIVGPVAFSGLTNYATRKGLGERGDDGRWGLKTGAKVLWGPPATLRVVRPVALQLEYARNGTLSSAVRFEPCAPGTPMFRGVGTLRRVTVFPGGFSLARPGCYEVVVQSGARTYRRTLSFGAGRCP